MAIPTPTSTLDTPSHSELHNAYVDVRMFGAVGDGVTDDTAAIQDALDVVLGSSLGQKLLFPWTSGGYKFGSLDWSHGAAKWIEIEVYGKLIPTATMSIPARQLSIIGRGGGAYGFFQNMPVALIDGGNITSGSVINLTFDGNTTAVYLQGLGITTGAGTAHGIEIDDGVCEVRMRGVWVQLPAGNTTGSAVRIHEGFGYYFDNCSFASASGGAPSVRIEAESGAAAAPRIVSMRDCFLNYRGVKIAQAEGHTGIDFLFDRVLCENMQEPFLTINTAGIFGYITLRHIDQADPSYSPVSLITTNGGTLHVTVDSCIGYDSLVAAASADIEGLRVVHFDSNKTLGQTSAFYWDDKYGRQLSAGARADKMQTLGLGATPDSSISSFFKLTHASPTTITDLAQDLEGQIVELLFTNGNVTIQHGSTIKLAGGANFVGTANDILRLRSDGTAWYEVSRSVNG